MLRAVLVFLLSIAGMAFGQDAEFRVEGDVIIFDTENLPEDGEIDDPDPEILLRLLRENPDVTTLQLNSSGGEVWSGDRMADIVIDFSLDTEVIERCTSVCALVFLGGENRKMRRGARIGFHRRAWSPSSVESYYERRREIEEWEDPFEFSSWVYEDTQNEMHQLLEYYVERGVTPAFAIDTLKQRNEGMWYPRRRELLDGGVLTE